MKRLSKLTNTLALSLLTSTACAADSESNDKVKFNGFASQGYIYSPETPYAGDASLDGSFDFREAGINASWEYSEQTRFSGQLLSRTASEASDGSIKLDYLLMDHVFYEGLDSTMGVRLGRVKNDVGIYNSSRDIPAARPGLMVPESIYFDSFRDVYLTVDGLNLYGNQQTNAGFFDWNLFIGTREIDSESFEYYALGWPVEGEYQAEPIAGLKLNFEPNSIPGLKVGLSHISTKLELENGQDLLSAQTTFNNLVNFAATPSAFGGLGLSGVALQNYLQSNAYQFVTDHSIDIRYWLASLQYGHKDWLFTTEYLKVFTDNQFESPLGIDSRSSETEAFYVQAEWFPTHNLEALLRYEELYLMDDRSGESLARSYDQTHGFAKAWTVGLKWLIDKNWSLGTQLSVNEGTAWLPVYEGMEQNPTKKYWNSYRMAVTYQF